LRGLGCTVPRRPAAPRFEPRRLAENAEIEQRRNGVVVQRSQSIAPDRPPQLLGVAAGAADGERDHRTSRQIDRTPVITNRETIGHQIHGVLPFVCATTCKKAARADRVSGTTAWCPDAANISDRMRIECCDF
jgi:hypothetical protein